ncbi:hypothetical protein QFZ91_000660 [Paraburkholderia sp. JPY419]
MVGRSEEERLRDDVGDHSARRVDVRVSGDASVLAGKKVPHDIRMPVLEVKPEELDAVRGKTPAGALANKEYTRDEVVAVVDGKK